MKIRIARKDFTIVGNAILRDKGLSLKAKGLACVMMSLPHGWITSTRGLTAICMESRPTILAAIAELRERGWMRLTQTRDKGKFSSEEYELIDSPQSDVENPVENPEQSDLPWSKKPWTGNLTTDKSNKEQSNTDKTDKTDRSAKRARLGLPAYTHGYTMHLIEKGAISANDPYLPELDEAIVRLIKEYGKDVVRSAINHAIQSERSKKATSPSAYLMAELESGCRRLKNINERTDDYLEFLDTLR